MKTEMTPYKLLETQGIYFLESIVYGVFNDIVVLRSIFIYKSKLTLASKDERQDNYILEIFKICIGFEAF